jgi:DNA-binding MarR family transcriptional regulator
MLEYPGVPEELTGTRPMCRVVYLLLRHNGATTLQELQELSVGGRASLCRALSDLEELDLVVKRPEPTDDRQNHFVLREQLDEKRYYARA